LLGTATTTGYNHFALPRKHQLVVPLHSIVVDLPLGCAKLVYFCYKFIFKCMMAAQRRKAAVKIEMQYGKLITDASFQQTHP